MVNNSTNICYQQNKQSSVTLTHWIQKGAPWDTSTSSNQNTVYVYIVLDIVCQHYPALAQESFITIRLEKLTFFSEHEVDRQDKITKNIHYLPLVISSDSNFSHIWVLTSKTSSLMLIDSSSEWNIKSKYNIAKHAWIINLKKKRWITRLATTILRTIMWIL
jgi:hypothetical protein